MPVNKASGGAPVSAIAHFAANAIPAGWLKANGAAVPRAAYPALFAAIGVVYGAGDGATTFNLPDLRGEFVRGWDDARGADPARTMGSSQADAIKAHAHVVIASSGSGGAVSSINGAPGGYSPDHTTANFGGAETRPRNVAMLACIKF